MSEKFLIIPLGDGVNYDDIPDYIKEAAENSERMWQAYFDELNKKRIEELKDEINRLQDVRSAIRFTERSDESYE